MSKFLRHQDVILNLSTASKIRHAGKFIEVCHGPNIERLQFLDEDTARGAMNRIALHLATETEVTFILP